MFFISYFILTLVKVMMFALIVMATATSSLDYAMYVPLLLVCVKPIALEHPCWLLLLHNNHLNDTICYFCFTFFFSLHSYTKLAKACQHHWRLGFACSSPLVYHRRPPQYWRSFRRGECSVGGRAGQVHPHCCRFE